MSPVKCRPWQCHRINRSHVRFVLWHPAEGNWAGYDGMEESSRAQFYRTEAKRLREKAENMDSPEIRQAYEGMAIHYELLLEGLESPAKRPPPRKAALEWGWGN
jgi:hypothetical protein